MGIRVLRGPSDPGEETATDARRNKGSKVSSSEGAGNEECGRLTLWTWTTCPPLGVMGDTSLALQDTLLPLCAPLFSAVGFMKVLIEGDSAVCHAIQMQAETSVSLSVSLSLSPSLPPSYTPH